MPCRRMIPGLASLLLLSSIAAADWPEFRGPTGQGVANTTNLPLTWSDTDGIVWRTAIPGLGWSSPVISAGKIYLTTAAERGKHLASLRALCLDAATGKTLWDEEVFHQEGDVEMHRKNSHASGTPIIDGDKLYVHFGPHGTACLSTADGRQFWSMKLDYKPQHGTGGSPALHKDLLIICCDGTDQQYVAGVQTSDGFVRWRVDRKLNPMRGFSFCTPLVIESNGQAQAICPGSNAVFSLDPATGEELWRVSYGDGYSVIPRPVYANGLVYVCTGWGKPKILAIDPNGRGDVTSTSYVKWESGDGAPNSPSIIVLKDRLYFMSDKGIATCLDALTGAQIWQARVGGNYSASPIATPERIYFQDEDGTAHVVKAADTFEELATNLWAPGLRTYASFAVEGNALILRSETELLRVEQR